MSTINQQNTSSTSSKPDETNTDNTSTTWRPDQGEHPRTIVGQLIDVRPVEGAYGAYPLVELQQDDGVVWVFHAFRDVAKSELQSCAPQPGDRISITYGGRSEKGYYLYRVRRADGRDSRVNWARFGEAAESVDPGEVPIAPAAGPPPAEVLEQQDEDDDIPF